MAVYRGPNIGAIIRHNTRMFLPRAGEIVTVRAKNKIGVYQPGWKPLSPVTIQRKSRRLRHQGNMRFGRNNRSTITASLSAADMPLLDTGRMRAGIRHEENLSAFETMVSAPFPMVEHEQDPRYGATVGLKLPPQRRVMEPALQESLPEIERQLEDFVARNF